MFFKTQIKSVSTNYAVDVSGRRLNFAGNLPCQAGDFVWTDGNIIFGDMQAKSAPYLFYSDSGGIPVLSDNLRGYFTKNGTFRNYNIAVDNWIVNNDKYFFHGSADLLDAEVSDDGDLFSISATNGGFFLSKDNNDIFRSTVTVRKNDSVLETFNLKYLNVVDSWVSDYETDFAENYPEFSVFNRTFASQLIAANIDTQGNTEFIFGTFAYASFGYPMEVTSSPSLSKDQFLNQTFLWESEDSLLYPDYNLKIALIALWEYFCGAKIVNISVDTYKKSNSPADSEPNFSAEYIFHRKPNYSIDTVRSKTKRSNFFWRTFDSYEFFIDDPQQRQLYFTLRFYDADLADPQYNCGKNNLPYQYLLTLLDEDGYPYYAEYYYPKFKQARLSALAWCWVSHPSEYPGYTDRTRVDSEYYTEEDVGGYLTNHEVPLVMTYRLYPSVRHTELPHYFYYIAVDFDNPTAETEKIGTPVSFGASAFYRFFDLNAPTIEGVDYTIKAALSAKESYFFKFTDANGKVHQQWLLRPENNGTIPRVFVSIDAVSNKAYLEQGISDKTVGSFSFPVQDNFYAKWRLDTPLTFDFTETDDGFFKINHSGVGGSFLCTSIFNSDSNISNIYFQSSPPDNQEVLFHYLPNLSIAPLSNNFLIGVHNRVSSDGYFGFDTGLKNFRLRYLNNISKAKR